LRRDRCSRIRDSAERILADDPDPVVGLRLLRDVLRKPSASGDVATARARLETSHWVQDLQREQRADGSWGRFHTADSGGKQRIAKTEAGVDRALALGLDACHPILSRASRYITDILCGRTAFPDRAERNQRWATGARMFAGATLAKIQPRAAVLDGVWETWADIARRTFVSGSYDPEAEIHAHRDLTGVSKGLAYLALHNKYALTLLGSRAVDLPRRTEHALAAWAWHKEGGLLYLGEQPAKPPACVRGGNVDRWLASVELISSFPSWHGLAGDVIGWLWGQRHEDGIWDFGPGMLPLSGTWRKRGRRQHDWSTRILALLAAYYER